MGTRGISGEKKKGGPWTPRHLVEKKGEKTAKGQVSTNFEKKRHKSITGRESKMTTGITGKTEDNPSSLKEEDNGTSEEGASKIEREGRAQ